MFDLNHNGIQFRAGGWIMSARDQLGRFMGEQPEACDDEILEKIALSDCIWNLVVPDDMFDDNSEPDGVTWGDSGYTETEGRYLWPEELELADYFFGRWTYPSREELTKRWAENAYRGRFPKLWEEVKDGFEEALFVTQQSSVQHDDGQKQLSYWSERSNRSWCESHGNHGRHKKKFWWSLLAQVRRDDKNYVRNHLPTRRAAWVESRQSGPASSG